MKRKETFFSKIQGLLVFCIKYFFYFFNLALLIGMGAEITDLWISDSFYFSDIFSNYPNEPEFLDKKSVEDQILMAMILKSILFTFGGFTCYEFLVKRKTFRRSILALFAIAFLWTSGASIFLFLPATEKANTIRTCLNSKITWNEEKHFCDLVAQDVKRIKQDRKRK